MSHSPRRLLLALLLAAPSALAADTKTPLPGAVPPLSLPASAARLAAPGPQLLLAAPAVPEADAAAPIRYDRIPGLAPEPAAASRAERRSPAEARPALPPAAELALLQELEGGLRLSSPGGSDGPSRKSFDGGKKPEPDASEAPEAPAPAAPAEAKPGPRAPRSPPLDPPFYGRNKPTQKPKSRKYLPTPADSEAARREFLAMARADAEVFNAPTWFEKGQYPELKKAIFAIAFLDESLTDLANGQEADIPADLEGDVVAAIAARRAQAYAAYSSELARMESELDRLPAAERRARESAREALERWHEQGLAAPALVMPVENLPDEFRRAAAAYQEMRDIAGGRRKGTKGEVEALDLRFRRGLRVGMLLRKARALDAVLASAVQKASPAEAKRIYDRAIAQAKDLDDPSNIAHAAAQMAAVEAGTTISAPHLGKQIRPTCTMHMLASLLAAAGLPRDLTDLIKEARVILGDPFVGMTTAFTVEQQLKLFRHYGRLKELRGGLFEALIRHGRNVKVSIEIGDPIYKHSLVLNGFYELDGRTYVAFTDSTSYFTPRMTIEDFALVLTSDNAFLFLRVDGAPRKR